MKTYTVTTRLGSERVAADLMTFEPSGHVAFYERRRGGSDRLVLAVHAPQTVVEEDADA